MIKQLLIIAGLMSCSFAYSQNVNIPDANFKASLVGNTNINTNSDGEIQLSVASNFTGVIDCPSSNIASLTGIEAFVKLKQLICYDNQITSLDTSKNISLTSLECANNMLNSLIVSPSTNLSTINCNHNQLKSLDVSKNIGLESFDCSNNKLTGLDVSKNTALFFLGCYQNLITNLDVSKNIALTELLCSNNSLTKLNVKNGNNVNVVAFDSKQNPNLNCIQVDDAYYSTSNWTDKDSWSTYNTNCGYLATTDIKKSTLNIYPNPLKNILNIETKDQFQKAEIYSVNGQLIKTSLFKEINVSDLSKGNYIIKIKTDKVLQTGKMIKE
ncbi:MAG: T9SS type A sorting domain-containing protein [Candidatus Pacebacteria bacterium]|nr:T9SS type A sorting domain-containing protein [Candidatus Paceibacterota bacterium]